MLWTRSHVQGCVGDEDLLRVCQPPACSFSLAHALWRNLVTAQISVVVLPTLLPCLLLLGTRVYRAAQVSTGGVSTHSYTTPLSPGAPSAPSGPSYQSAFQPQPQRTVSGGSAFNAPSAAASADAGAGQLLDEALCSVLDARSVVSHGSSMGSRGSAAQGSNSAVSQWELWELIGARMIIHVCTDGVSFACYVRSWVSTLCCQRCANL